jgi:hypothetical protein
VWLALFAAGKLSLPRKAEPRATEDEEKKAAALASAG